MANCTLYITHCSVISAFPRLIAPTRKPHCPPHLHLLSTYCPHHTIPVTGVSNCKGGYWADNKDSRPPSFCLGLINCNTPHNTFSPLPTYSLPKTISESSFHQREVGQTLVSKCTEYSPAVLIIGPIIYCLIYKARKILCWKKIQCTGSQFPIHGGRWVVSSE